MQVHHEVAHLGIVDGQLRLLLPHRVGRGIVRIDPDEVDRVEILEDDVVALLDLAADDEVQELLAWWSGLLLTDLVRSRSISCGWGQP